MYTMKHAHATVRDWFAQHGARAEDHRVSLPDDVADEVRAWSISYSGIDLVIAIEVSEGRIILQVSAAVLALNAQTDPALMPALLRLNREVLAGCAFALDEDDEVLILVERDAARVDPAALGQLVEHVHEAASALTAQLAEQFGADSLLGAAEE